MRILRLLLPSLLGLGLLTSISCSSASKTLSKGRYDLALEKSLKVLHKEPSNAKHLEILGTAYELGTLNDEERIISLKTAGEPSLWDDIASAYQRIRDRDQKILQADASVQAAIEFAPKKVDEDLLSAKRKAAEYHYTLGVQLMNPNDRFACREAYSHFLRVSNYFSDYKDNNELKEHARQGGFTHVLLLMENRSGKYIDPACKFALMQNAQPSSLLNKSWVAFHYEGEPDDFHYVYTFVLQNFAFSPTRNSLSSRTERKTIDDGWDYKTDAKGKPVLDSAGEFIKIAKKKTISCVITESQLEKRAIVEGDLQLIEVASQRWVTTERIRVEESARTVKYSFSGDRDALSKETLNRMKHPSSGGILPPDRVLLEEACERLGVSIARHIDAQTHLIK